MEGKEIAPFALTYRRRMTRQSGYTKQAAYEFSYVLGEPALRRFGPTHEVERPLREMGSVKYHGDIAKLLLEMANLIIHSTVTGIAWTMMIEDEVPEDALR